MFDWRLAHLAASVHERLEACHKQAMAILKAECDTHLWLAKTLLNPGVLEGEELAEVGAEHADNYQFE